MFNEPNTSVAIDATNYIVQSNLVNLYLCICPLLYLYFAAFIFVSCVWWGGGRYPGGRKSSAEAATETDCLMEKEGQSCVPTYIIIIIVVVVVVLVIIVQQPTNIDPLADGVCVYEDHDDGQTWEVGRVCEEGTNPSRHV